MIKFLNGKILLGAFFLISLILSAILFTKADVTTEEINRADVTMRTQKNPKFEIRDNRSLLVDGQPFFPFGFYISVNDDRHQDALHEIAAAGFNTTINYWKNLDDYSAFLDEAEKLDIYAIADLEDTGTPFKAIEQLKDKPALLGWFIADDVSSSGRASNDQILSFHRKVRAISPNLLTYISIGGWWTNYVDYAHVANLIGGQSYPIGAGRFRYRNQLDKVTADDLEDDLGAVYEQFSTAYTQTDKYKPPLIANLQTFKWNLKELRWPTPNEVYNMTYQSLLAGVKGIVFYTYQNDSTYLQNKPEIWSQLKLLVPEIKKLSPLLLDGTFTKLNTQFDDVIAGEWSLDNSVYIVVLSTSQTKTRKVSLKIPAKATATAQPLFPERPSGMVYEHGKLDGLIKPEEVHVYQLSSVPLSEQK